MTSPSRKRPILYLLYANAVLLAAILVALISRGGSVLPTASAAAVPQPIAGNGSLYLMPGQLLNNVWGCYVLNVDTQTLCTYAYNGNQLRLIASRNIRYDYQLGNYNTHPDPEEIHRLVDMEHEHIRGMNPPAPQGPAATQPLPKVQDQPEKTTNNPAP